MNKIFNHRIQHFGGNTLAALDRNRYFSPPFALAGVVTDLQHSSKQYSGLTTVVQLEQPLSAIFWYPTNWSPTLPTIMQLRRPKFVCSHQSWRWYVFYSNPPAVCVVDYRTLFAIQCMVNTNYCPRQAKNRICEDEIFLN